MNNAPELWRETRAQIHAAREDGVDIHGQVGCRPIGMMMGLETSVHPFSTHPAWTAMSNLTPAQRFERLQRDPELRRRLVEERPTDKHTLWIESALPMTYVADDSYDYEPATSDSIAARAQAEGRNPWAYALEAMMERQGKALLSHTFENYTE